jgi:hypothetical protein
VLRSCEESDRLGRSWSPLETPLWACWGTMYFRCLAQGSTLKALRARPSFMGHMTWARCLRGRHEG